MGMKRVLIVDDAIDLGRLLQDALKVNHPDIPITVVPSAEEALLESTRFSFDLLVTDLRLPGMNGLELIRKIRVRQPHIKVILITALMPEDTLFRQKDEVKPEIFMRKPITATGFMDAVDQLIGKPEPASPPAPVVGKPQPVGPAQQQALLNELAAIMPGEPADPKPEPVKKMTARLSLPPEMAPPADETSLSAGLSQLRARLGALSAILLDERGRPVAQAGDLPGIPLEDSLTSPVMAALSAGAKIAYLLAPQRSHSVQAYRGTDLDLVLAPVGQYALIVALKSGRSALRLALAFEEALNAQAELVSALESLGMHMQTAVEAVPPQEMLAQMGAPGQPAEPPSPPEILDTPLAQDQDLERFQELFAKKTTGQLKLEDPDMFWEAAAPGDSGEVTAPGVLSFEQAQKLGLFPADSSQE
jgi:CheY-like chemotaxis protein